MIVSLLGGVCLGNYHLHFVMFQISILSVFVAAAFNLSDLYIIY